jgi:hypothetical protein
MVNHISGDHTSCPRRNEGICLPGKELEYLEFTCHGIPNNDIPAIDRKAINQVMNCKESKEWLDQYIISLSEKDGNYYFLHFLTLSF